MEVKRPRRRFIDLQNLTKLVDEKAKGKVEVLNLRFAKKDDIRELKKAEASKKLYKVLVDFDREVLDEELQTIKKNLTKVIIRQQTPLRVLHRRADLVREKYIYETQIKRLAPNRLEMKIHCQGGLYIKELISGDEGRTIPSIVSIIDAKAKPIELDVLKIFLEES